MLASLVLIGSSAVPASGQEAQVVAPPGNSGVQEYLEVVPAAGGDRLAPGGGQAAPTHGEAGRTSPTPREVFGPRTARALSRLGPDGRAAAALAAAGAPSDARAAGRNPTKTALRRGSVTSEADAGRAEAVASALAGSGGGMGLAFPLLLLGTLTTALGLLATRRVTRRG